MRQMLRVRGINFINENVKNRNELYEKYNIKCCVSNLPDRKLKMVMIDGIYYDHKECYKTFDNKHMFLFSNGYYTDDEKTILRNNGFNEIKYVYSNCLSFFKIV